MESKSPTLQEPRSAVVHESHGRTGIGGIGPRRGEGRGRRRDGRVVRELADGMDGVAEGLAAVAVVVVEADALGARSLAARERARGVLRVRGQHGDGYGHGHGHVAEGVVAQGRQPRRHAEREVAFAVVAAVAGGPFVEQQPRGRPAAVVARRDVVVVVVARELRRLPRRPCVLVLGAQVRLVPHVLLCCVARRRGCCRRDGRPLRLCRGRRREAACVGPADSAHVCYRVVIVHVPRRQVAECVGGCCCEVRHVIGNVETG